MLYVPGKETQNQGMAFQPDFVWQLSAAKLYQPPPCLPTFSTTSSMLTRRFSYRKGSALAVLYMSWPDCDWASAAILDGICRCAMVSTRTVQLFALPKASACFLSSSSEAGTKWFQERKVSSRFWAKAGALPRASHEAIPAV